MDTVVVFTPAPGPSSGILDDFNRADEILTASANWVDLNGDSRLYVVSNQLTVGAGEVQGVDDFAQWDADTFAADQFVEVVVTAAPPGGYDSLYLFLRIQGVQDFIYCRYVRDVGETTEEYYIREVVAGVDTLIGSAEPNGAVSYPATFRLEVSGTTVTAKIDGNTEATGTTSITGTGKIGLHMGNLAWVLDDFDGGAL